MGGDLALFKHLKDAQFFHFAAARGLSRAAGTLRFGVEDGRAFGRLAEGAGLHDRFTDSCFNVDTDRGIVRALGIIDALLSDTARGADGDHLIRREPQFDAAHANLDAIISERGFGDIDHRVARARIATNQSAMVVDCDLARADVRFEGPAQGIRRDLTGANVDLDVGAGEIPRLDLSIAKIDIDL